MPKLKPPAQSTKGNTSASSPKTTKSSNVKEHGASKAPITDKEEVYLRRIKELEETVERLKKEKASTHAVEEEDEAERDNKSGEEKDDVASNTKRKQSGRKRGPSKAKDKLDHDEALQKVLEGADPGTIAQEKHAFDIAVLTARAYQMLGKELERMCKSADELCEMVEQM